MANMNYSADTKITKNINVSATFNDIDWSKTIEEIFSTTVDNRYKLVDIVVDGVISKMANSGGGASEFQTTITTFIPSDNAIHDINYDAISSGEAFTLGSKKTSVGFTKHHTYSYMTEDTFANYQYAVEWRAAAMTEVVRKVRAHEETKLKATLIATSTAIPKVYANNKTSVSELSSTSPITWAVLKKAKYSLEDSKLSTSVAGQQVIDPIVGFKGGDDFLAVISKKAKRLLLEDDDFYKYFLQDRSAKTEAQKEELIATYWGIKLATFNTEFTITSGADKGSVALMLGGKQTVRRVQWAEGQGIKNNQFYAYDHQSKPLGSDNADIANNLAWVVGWKGYTGFAVTKPQNARVIIYSYEN